MRRAPTILFALSIIVFAIGIAVAVMTAHLTADQASNAMLSGVASRTNGIAQIQLFAGIMAALQNATWPFAAGALVWAVQSRPAR